MTLDKLKFTFTKLNLTLIAIEALALIALLILSNSVGIRILYGIFIFETLILPGLVIKSPDKLWDIKALLVSLAFWSIAWTVYLRHEDASDMSSNILIIFGLLILRLTVSRLVRFIWNYRNTF